MDKAGASSLMKTLLINSSDKNAFAAILQEGKTSAVYAREFADPNSGKSPDKLINCLYKLSTEFDIGSIDNLAVTIGPGSFTGIRVGLSLAKGMLFGTSKKLIPINSFELILKRLEGFELKKDYCVVVAAKLPEYYFAVYSGGQKTAEGADTLENIQKMLKNDAIIAGDFDDETQLKHCYFSVVNVKNQRGELEAMADIAEEAISAGKFLEPQQAEPMYLKDFNFRKM